MPREVMTINRARVRRGGQVDMQAPVAAGERWRIRKGIARVSRVGGSTPQTTESNRDQADERIPETRDHFC